MMSSSSIWLRWTMVVVIVVETVTQSFDCKTLHTDAFADRDGKKCYYPDRTVTRDYLSAVSTCENLEIDGFGDWILANPRNYREDHRIREVLGSFESDDFWWYGQNDRSGEGVYKNVDDPANCPGIFIQWQKDASATSTASQPNGNINNQEDQDCMVLHEMNTGRPTGGGATEAYQDKTCYFKLYSTFCKHTTTAATITCTDLHAGAVQWSGDTQSCYLSEADATGSATMKTFYEAAQFCEDLSAGGVEWTMPDIRSREEAEFLRDPANSVFVAADGPEYWVGVNDTVDEEVYYYYNQPEGCPPVYLRWDYPVQPDGSTDNSATDEDCIAIQPDMDDGMNDKECDDEYYTPCEMTIPCLMFEREQYTIGEQNQTLTIRAVLLNHKTDTVTVEFNAQDMTTSSYDYTLPDTNSLTFESNEDYKDIQISINATDGLEAIDSFTLTLQNPTATALCEPYSTTVYISDESTLFWLEADEVVVYEDSIVDVTMYRAGYLRNTDIITCSVKDGSANLNVDYTSPGENTYTFLPGDEKVVKSFVILADEVEDDMESFLVSFDIDPASTSASTAVIRNPNQTEIFIRERPVSHYDFEKVEYNVQESDVTLDILIKRTGDTSSAGYVHVSTKPVTASPELDYEPIENEQISFGPSQIEVLISLRIRPDSIPESVEIVKLCLSDPGQREDLGPLNSTIVIITDDNDVEYCFGESTFVISETDGFLTIPVTRSGLENSEANIRVATLDQTAFGESDYTIPIRDVSIPAGAGSTTVEINILPDGQIESPESFQLQLVTSGNIVCTADIWILDSDTCTLPCVNGGVCNSNNICACPAGFSGLQCEIKQQEEEDPCSLVECFNDGVCAGLGACLCQPGFTGTRCEIELCPDGYCQNEGTCVVEQVTNSVMCLCQAGYEGGRCNEQLQQPEEQTQGLSGGGVAGIILGGIGLLVIVVIAGVVFLWLRRSAVPKFDPGANAAYEPNAALNYGFPNSDNWQLFPSPYTQTYRTGPGLY